MFWPASALPSAERRFQPHYNSSFLHVTFLLAIVKESLCIEDALSLCIENMLIRLSRGVLKGGDSVAHHSTIICDL